MRIPKKATVFVGACLSMLSVSSFASGVGNGGISVVCRDQAGKISSAQVLDIYEGEVRFGRKYENNLDTQTLIDLAKLKLTKFPLFLEDFEEELSKIKVIMTFIPEGNRLLPTNDAFPKIEKIGCNFEQLANYTDEGELLVSQEIYDELSEVNKAALLVHETVYAIFRRYSEFKDSQISRKFTAQILSENADQKVINTIIETNFGNRYSRDGNICGIKGSIEERIKNCNQSIGNFALVARTSEGYKVYKDLSSNLIWGDRLSSRMSHYNAEETCSANLLEVAKINLAWRLPSKEEYKEAEKRGIRNALPNMNDFFWTSSVGLGQLDYLAWIFNGNFGDTETMYFRNNRYFVRARCVAQ